jgi:hypothetical protein
LSCKHHVLRHFIQARSHRVRPTRLNLHIVAGDSLFKLTGFSAMNESDVSFGRTARAALWNAVNLTRSSGNQHLFPPEKKEFLTSSGRNQSNPSYL